MSRALQHIVPYAFVAILSLGIGYWAGTGQKPVLPEPVVEYLNPSAYYNRVPQFRSVPDFRFVHIERTDTVTHEVVVRIPVSYEPLGVFEHRPITVKPGSVHFSYYDVHSGQYVTDRYRVPERRFRLEKGVQVSSIPYPWTGFDLYSVGGFAELRYKSIGIAGQFDYLVGENDLRSLLNLRIYF